MNSGCWAEVSAMCSGARAALGATASTKKKRLELTGLPARSAALTLIVTPVLGQGVDGNSVSVSLGALVIDQTAVAAAPCAPLIMSSAGSMVLLKCSTMPVEGAMVLPAAGVVSAITGAVMSRA